MVEAYLFLSILLLCLEVQMAHSAVGTWEYGEGEVAKWKGACKSGQNQSPIDIIPRNTIKRNLNGFAFVNYNKKVGEMVMTKNAHTVKFEIEKDQPLKLMGGGLPGSQYLLWQGHLHWSHSEHTFDGVASEVELHLVHVNLDRGQTLKEAAGTGESDALAVLGVMFGVVDQDSTKLDKFFKALERVEGKNKLVHVDKDFKISHFLPDNVDMFYRYNGSLTTPECDEIVQWTVFKEKVLISRQQYDILKTLTKTDGSPLRGNYRPTQPLNGRTVWDVDARQFDYEMSSSEIPRPLAAKVFVTIVLTFFAIKTACVS